MSCIQILVLGSASKKPKPNTLFFGYLIYIISQHCTWDLCHFGIQLIYLTQHEGLSTQGPGYTMVEVFVLTCILPVLMGGTASHKIQNPIGKTCFGFLWDPQERILNKFESMITLQIYENLVYKKSGSTNPWWQGRFLKHDAEKTTSSVEKNIKI